MVNRSGLRQVPWQSWEHWLWVADAIFSGCSDRVAAAQNRIKAWQGRGHVPISVETTCALTSVQQRDLHYNPELPPRDVLPDDMLRMMYAMAIQRLVNGVVDVSAKRNSSSVASRADFAGLPRLLVDIRHETAHNELPGLPLLHSASEQALEWLKSRYWEPQRQALGNVRQDLKAKLLEHCRLVVDILTPVARPDDDGLDEDVEGESDERLVKVMRTMRHIHKRNLKAMKQERVRVFNELEELCLSTTSELVSILVDDGLLEQGVLPGCEREGRPQSDSDGSDTHSFDFEAATYTAWRYTICRLSNKLPRLPDMLLVALVNRIGSSRRIARSVPTPIGPSRSSISPSLSLTPLNRPVEIENGLANPALNQLIAWCAWLLESEESEAAFVSVSQEAVKSKTLGISRKLSVKADLGEELCRELLRSCLHLSGEGGPVDELLSLIAFRAGSKRLQEKALKLAKFGSIFHRASSSDQKTGGNMEVDSVVGSGPKLKEESADGPAAGEEAVEPFASRPDLPKIPNRVTETIDQDDSLYQKMKKQQEDFFARAASEGNVPSRNCVQADDGEETDGMKAAAEGGARPLLRNSSITNLQQRKWTVTETWKPCAIGMIPSPYSVVGILPSLDFPETSGVVENVFEGQKAGGGERTSEQQVDIDNGTRKDKVTNSVETHMAKRKGNVEQSSPAGEKRAKKEGRYVHFSVEDEKSGIPCEPPASKRWTTNGKQIAKSELPVSGSSLLQGCLYHHGYFLHVSPRQLESLKAAVHVL